jgi:hypothetical protein
MFQKILYNSANENQIKKTFINLVKSQYQAIFQVIATEKTATTNTIFFNIQFVAIVVLKFFCTQALVNHKKKSVVNKIVYSHNFNTSIHKKVQIDMQETVKVVLVNHTLSIIIIDYIYMYSI